MMWLEVLTNNLATYVHVIMPEKKRKEKKGGEEQRYVKDASCVRIQFG